MIGAPRNHGEICVYCGDRVLTGREKPEHPIPAAVGSSFVVYTVCNPCNDWANTEVDQPWLKDDWTRIHRAKYDIRDTRRAQSRRPLDPMREGFTEEGVRVTADENWRPALGSRIIEDGDQVRIVAGSVEEAERLLEKVRARAEVEGKSIEMRQWREEQVRPRISASVKVDVVAWRRMAAKIALATGSATYPEEWRISDDAKSLRHWMRDRDAASPGDSTERFAMFPERFDDAHSLRSFVEPPEHCLVFAGSARTSLLIILFGEILMSLPVSTTGEASPKVAWRLDPRTPLRDGRTTFDELILRSISRDRDHNPHTGYDQC